jgi:hypothetical protein
VVSDDLMVLQNEFPAFSIWQEETPGRSRYVARSRHQGLNPHTVVTDDLQELRDALQSGQTPALLTQPNPFAGTSSPR